MDTIKPPRIKSKIPVFEMKKFTFISILLFFTISSTSQINIDTNKYYNLIVIAEKYMPYLLSRSVLIMDRSCIVSKTNRTSLKTTVYTYGKDQDGIYFKGMQGGAFNNRENLINIKLIPILKALKITTFIFPFSKKEYTLLIHFETGEEMLLFNSPKQKKEVKFRNRNSIYIYRDWVVFE